MPPSAPASPTSPPPVSNRFGARRWLASGMLFVGAVLAAVGPFLPWVRVHYAAVADEPASTFNDMPGRDLAQILHEEVTAPSHFTLSFTLVSLLFFGAPLFFAALSARTLLRHDWLPSRRVRRLGVALAVAGAIVTILMAYVLVNLVGSFDVVRATRTPLPGAAVTLIGYLCALIGATLLPARRAAAER